MDDFNISSITESKNEWTARLTNILTPCIIEGIKSIFEESDRLCLENDEEEKYLMTFQNLLNNVPKWSSQVIESEKERILSSSSCSYLQDLLTCVHITQLKALTVSRVGSKQKKINIDIPNLDIFIHKTYINVARKIYINVYLFEKDILPLQIQKNNRELEIIIKECILNTIRESIPLENILKSYLDETQETDVEIEEKKELVPDEEEIEKQKRIEKERELEDIKAEVRAKLEKEYDTKSSNLNSINSDINNINENLTEYLDNDLEDDLDYDSADDASVISHEKLVIEDPKYSKPGSSNINLDVDLDIKNLDSDPDKLDLDILDLDKKEEKKDDINIELDIEEL
tara:strand:- start:4841 stop:5872 length:1032 start_codon:yes stop_codon:yes gene_type:complete